jgi:hypothetical protein
MSRRMFRATLCLAFLMGVPVASAQDFSGPQLYRLPPAESGEGVAPIVDAAPGPAVVEEIAPVEEVLPEEEGYWLFPAAWYKPLAGSLELGLNGTEGNSQTFNVRAGGKAKYTQPWLEQSYEMIHVDNSADGVKTALNGYFDARWVFPFADTPWSYFAHTRVEYDDFREYDLRVSGDTGLGYDLWKTDFSKLQVRSGLSTSREIGGSENRFVPELVFGMDLDHKFDDRQKVCLAVDYYPAVDDFADDYRINTTASYEIVVSQAWGLSAKLSVIDRYDNTPQGRRPNDINYAALMLWAF